MSFYIDEVKLLQAARGEEIEALIPKGLRVELHSHSTGCQPIIVTTDAGNHLVWQGSLWYSASYDFNDHDKKPGIQPGFELLSPLIDRFFRDLAATIAQRKADEAVAAERAKLEREQEEMRQKREAAVAIAKANNLTLEDEHER